MLSEASWGHSQVFLFSSAGVLRLLAAFSFMFSSSVFSAAMETSGEQNQQGSSPNGSSASGTSPRTSAMNSMSLYERQAVQVGVRMGWGHSELC